MRKYIILARSIVNIGGEEIYNRNKYLFLRQKGIDVTIISVTSGKIIINDLIPFKNNIIEELCNEPFYYSNKQKEKFLEKIKSKIQDTSNFDEIIIECHTPKLSVWGELLAKEIGGRSFCLLTDDRFPPLSSSTASFFEYKLLRHELAGISKSSLQLLFGNHLSLEDDKKYFLSFNCINSIESVDNDFGIQKEKYDFIIGTIIRLEKVCVPFILDNILDFARKHKDKKILFIFFGGSSNKKLEKEIIKKMNVYSNLEFLLTGIIFPVPLVEVEKVDLFINVAGAASATKRMAIPTLSIELENGRPLGILGVTTNSSQYRSGNDNCPWDTISEALENLLIMNKFSLKEIKNKLIKDPLKVDFTQHDNFIADGLKNEMEYYDFSNYHVSKLWKIMISFLYSLLGIRGLIKIMKLYRLLFRKK